MLPSTAFSTHIRSPLSLVHTLGFCVVVTGCYVVKKKRATEKMREKETEMDSAKEIKGGREKDAPQRIGLTLLMTLGSVALLNSLHYLQGGRENNTCCRGT